MLCMLLPGLHMFVLSSCLPLPIVVCYSLQHLMQLLSNWQMVDLNNPTVLCFFRTALASMNPPAEQLQEEGMSDVARVLDFADAGLLGFLHKIL